MEMLQVHVVVNGEVQGVDPGTNLTTLLARFQLQPKQVAIEINCDLVPRRQFDSTTLNDGDRIEIVTLVGGG